MAPNHWRSVLLLPTVLAGTLGCGGAEVASNVEPALTTIPAPVTAAPVVPTPTSAASGASFTAADGRFSAQFPAPPERYEGSNGEFTFVTYTSSKDGRDLAVGYIDLPKKYDELLKDQRWLLRQLAKEEGTLSTKDTMYLGRPAHDIVVPRVEEGVNGYRHERSFLAANRKYTLRSWSMTPAPPPEHATLLTTFKLTN